jgi:hypothetical protein
MLPLQAGREASSGVGAFFYERHRPEQTLLYQIIEQHYPDFLSAMEVQHHDGGIGGATEPDISICC